jgi:hypothetical protein
LDNVAIVCLSSSSLGCRRAARARSGQILHVVKVVEFRQFRVPIRIFHEGHCVQLDHFHDGFSFRADREAKTAFRTGHAASDEIPVSQFETRLAIGTLHGQRQGGVFPRARFFDNPRAILENTPFAQRGIVKGSRSLVQQHRPRLDDFQRQGADLGVAIGILPMQQLAVLVGGGIVDDRGIARPMIEAQQFVMIGGRGIFRQPQNQVVQISVLLVRHGTHPLPMGFGCSREAAIAHGRRRQPAVWRRLVSAGREMAAALILSSPNDGISSVQGRG